MAVSKRRCPMASHHTVASFVPLSNLSFPRSTFANRGSLKESNAVALDMITELDRGAGILLDQLPEVRSPLHEEMPAQILAIEVQEILAP
jgi:hypothetical protein